MGSLTGLALLVVLAGVVLYVLFLVVRAAVKEGIQQALRTDLLDQRVLLNDAPPPASDPT